MWSLKQCQVICGHLVFASMAVPLGMLHLRHLQRQLRSFSGRSAKKKLAIPPPARQACRWWIRHLSDASPLFLPPASIFVATDASDIGFGAVIQGRFLSRRWTARQRRWSINRRELHVLLTTLQLNGREWENRTVLFQTDNTSVVACVNRQGTTKSATLLQLSMDILVLADKSKMSIVAHHLPGRFNLAPDALSRPDLPMPEWHLCATTARSFWHLLGPPSVDLFASHRAHQVRRYVSRDATDRAAEWTDAFSRRWERETFWCFPPPPEVPRVLRHIEQASDAVFYLVTPHWSGAWWTPSLQRSASSGPHPVPSLESSLIDLATGRPPPKVTNIQLSVWTIRSGRRTSNSCRRAHETS